MLKTLTFTLYVLCMALSVISALFGVVSWVLLKEWRQFRHFAFLSFIVAGASFLTWMHAWAQMKLSIEFFLTTIVILITHVQMSHWQLITTVIIYMALVNVFSSVNVSCKYLWACLFSWLLPVIEGLVMIFPLGEWVICWIIVSVVELSIMVANVVLYVRVVCSLVRLMMRQKISTRDVCRKVLVSTLACVTAGVPPIVGTVAVICYSEYGAVSLLDADVAMLPNLANVVLANACFLSMKTHRLLWAEYVGKRTAARVARRDLELHLQPRRNDPPV